VRRRKPDVARPKVLVEERVGQLVQTPTLRAGRFSGLRLSLFGLPGWAAQRVARARPWPHGLGHVRSRVLARLERCGMWGLLDQTVLVGSGFTLNVLVAHDAGPVEYGLFTLLQCGSQFVGQLVKSAFGDALLIEARGRSVPDPAAAALLPLTACHAAFGLVLAAGWLALGGHAFGLPAPNPFDLALLALLPFASFGDVVRAIRLAVTDERQLFVGDLLVGGGRVLGFSLAIFGLTGVRLGLVALISSGLASIFSVPRCLHGMRFARLAELWRLGRWLACDAVFYGLAAFGVWLLALPRAGEAVASDVRAALQLFGPVQAVMLGLNMLLLRRLAGEGGRLAGAARTLVAVQVTMVVGGSATLIALGPRATRMVFGNGFSMGRGELFAVAIAMLAQTACEVNLSRLRSVGMVRSAMFGRILITAVAIAAAYSVGTSLVGVMVALLVSQLAGTAFAYAARLGSNRREVTAGVSASSGSVSLGLVRRVVMAALATLHQ